ncbi:uncharacterized protein LY89DRAFT_741533 [Mollisia scopiformis]|uniref:Zn(2)-C6 fungal-type domain-containing protein n=1 Tax=Mollisia scopiformis TaxID=149040 RepID=A0A132B8I2_MOLSC|nr:uncharacterized protein LY89DRAFT_741533 [Mollisia scopiformis]KUJ08681.1 hypothetical protein LY89DRAFT_741533 [Mollisia scopiformis]
MPVRQPRKRRRPALSCNECRRRKVKCDQKVPCTPCTKSKTAFCKYDPDATPKGREAHHTAPTNHTTSNLLPREMIDTASARNVNGIATTHIAPNTLYPNTDSQRTGTTSTQQAFNQNLEKGQSVQELNDRIQQLETMVTSLINPEQEKSSAENDVGIFPKLKGSTQKTRLFTTSHWMNTKKEFDQILALKKVAKQSHSSELNDALKKCKDLARAIKRQRPSSSYTLPDFRSEVPVRATADLLVQLYFRTFESLHRILHRQSFFREYEQYWNNPATASDSFIIKLLVIMSIGAIFAEEETTSMRFLGLQWINTAQVWLNSPLDKSRLNLASVEIQCLLIIARQTHSIGGDLLWISVGSLIRTAMSIGLHRDPANFPKIPVLQAEIRRRIWATIIELAIQASLDCGMPPMISFEDFDCSPPSNYNDANLIEGIKTYPPKHPSSEMTESSLQITLLKSLPTRLKIFTTINDVRTERAYEKVLALSTELTSYLHTHTPLHRSSSVTTTHKSLLDLHVRRFLIALHLPFAIHAKTDPRFYFSRKIALDTALLIFSYPSSADFEAMKLVSGGPFREAYSRASSAISLELISQIQEDSTSAFPSTAAFPMMEISNPRKGLHDVVSSIVDLSRRRLERGETNVKGFLFWCMVQAQTDAMERGVDVGNAIAGRAKAAAEEAYDILRKQVAYTPTPGSTSSLTPPELSVDWDALMQDTTMDFDIANTWLLDSWETI